jgi:hypothetical protein
MISPTGTIEQIYGDHVLAFVTLVPENIPQYLNLHNSFTDVLLRLSAFSHDTIATPLANPFE